MAFHDLPPHPCMLVSTGDAIFPLPIATLCDPGDFLPSQAEAIALFYALSALLFFLSFIM